MDRPFDVAVIGAGLAGLATASRLATAGLRTALIDRKQDLTRGIHTTGIFVRKTLADFQFPPGSLGPPISQVVLATIGGREVLVASDKEEFRLGRMANLYGQLLADAEHRGVVWLPGTRLVELACEPSGARLNLVRQGRQLSLRARFVIGADGARSTVAAYLGLDQNHHWIVGVEEVLGGVRYDGPPRFWCLLDPVIAPGYLGWVIHDGEEVHLGVGGYGHRFVPAECLEALRHHAKRWLDLSAGRLIERRGGLIPVGGVLHRIGSTRGLLVGDAAGAPSPLTAGGLDPCLRLAALASHLTARWLATNDPAELARYDGSRFRARFVSRLLMRRGFNSLASRPLVSLAMRFLATPPGTAFARHVFFGRGSFPDVGVPLGQLAQRAQPSS